MITLVLLSVLVAFLAMLAVGYPILARRRAGEPLAVSAGETVDELLAQRDAVFQALRELRFDHEVGKITDEDFAAFEVSLKQTAANSLRAVDEWEARADLDLGPEMRRLAAERALAIPAGGIVCPRGGHAAAPEDRFCGRCGATLPEAVSAVTAEPLCPKCGKPIEVGDRFCAGCGQALSA